MCVHVLKETSTDAAGELCALIHQRTHPLGHLLGRLARVLGKVGTQMERRLVQRVGPKVRVEHGEHLLRQLARLPDVPFSQ